MVKRFEQYQDMIARLYPTEIISSDPADRILTRPITFCVTNACQLRCDYCYEVHKGDSYMSFETAKKFIDLLLTGDKGMDQYITPKVSPAVSIEFIGGEPFLAVDLMDQIVDYWMDRTTELMHPWADKFMLSVCSNGVAYFDPKVQKFLEKHKDRLSFSITIDGNKELHDACRVFAGTRKGSYDIAVKAAKDWMDKGYYMGSKITIAPENLPHLYDAIIHMVDLGYDEVLANCVYEAEWTNEHANLFYNEGKKIADEFLRRELNFEDEFYCALFEEDFFHPKSEDEIDNWCFPAGTMILTPNGELPIESLNIGDKVMTKNSIQPIEDILNHSVDKTLKIKASGMFETETTPEHPYWIKKKVNNKYTDPIWVAAKDIKQGDKLCLYKSTFGEEDIDKNIAYIAGRYIGDGWHSTTGYKICCSHEEAEELKEALDCANIKYSSYTYPTVEQFSISIQNKELINIISNCGINAKNKHLPKNIYSWNKESAKALLLGYLDADGYYDVKKKSYRCNTISKQLAQELLDLLRSLDYMPLCSVDARAGELEIQGRKINIQDRYEISYREDCFSKFCEEDKENNCVWSTVRSIIEQELYTEVYNLTVEKEHNFVANGAIVHNCGGTGSMIACDWDGEIYPCIRYMEMSLGDDQPKMPIGNVDDGLMQTEEHLSCVNCLRKIDRRTQSTDECFYCPIAEGCSWCSAWNYQLYGTPDKRCTRICVMHKARALFNAYFWNTYYRKMDQDKRMKLHIPDEWALEIIDEDELNMLKELSREDF